MAVLRGRRRQELDGRRRRRRVVEPDRDRLLGLLTEIVDGCEGDGRRVREGRQRRVRVGERVRVRERVRAVERVLLGLDTGAGVVDLNGDVDLCAVGEPRGVAGLPVAERADRRSGRVEADLDRVARRRVPGGVTRDDAPPDESVGGRLARRGMAGGNLRNDTPIRSMRMQRGRMPSIIENSVDRATFGSWRDQQETDGVASSPMRSR